MKSSKVIFNVNALRNVITKNITQEQTARLIEYAKERIVTIGDAIKQYHSRNNMDRTGNLLNSLCWGVTYKGKMQGSGFYREEMLKNKGIDGSSTSWLHEFTPDTAKEVNGHAQATKFIKSQQGIYANGWRVFFAILADYWGYWESGFRMKSGGGNSPIPRSTRFLKFAVMSQAFDSIRMDLKPAKTSLSVYIPHYAYKSNKYKGKKRKIGTPRLMSKSQYGKSLNRNIKRSRR